MDSGKYPQKRAIPLTKTGLTYIAAGVLLLSTGIIRGEIAATLCGATLLLYALFAFLSVTVSLFFWKNILISLEWTGKDTVRLHIIKNDYAQHKVFFLFAKIHYLVRYITLPENPNSRVFTLDVPISGTETIFHVSLPPRGRYTGLKYCLQISDFSNFFICFLIHPEIPFSDKLQVFPEPEATVYCNLPLGKSGNQKGKSTFHRSNELYETRQYRPGDDPRKINWKVFAHTGELSVREGELLPPPSEKYVFLINLDLPATLKGNAKKEATERFDILINRATRLALDLVERNRIVTILTENEIGKFEILSVTPSDINPRTKLCKAFTSYQLGTTNNSFLLPMNLLPVNSIKIVFLMPEQDFSGYTKHASVFFLGPVLSPSVQQSRVQRLKNFIYLNSSSSPKLNSSEYHTIFANVLLSIRKKGFNIETI